MSARASRRLDQLRADPRFAAYRALPPLEREALKASARAQLPPSLAARESTDARAGARVLATILASLCP